MRHLQNLSRTLTGALLALSITATTQAQTTIDPAKMTEDGLLIEGANSKAKFQTFSIHVEFRTPYKPKARGQQRGNSGLYMQGRYETQILDSFVS